MSQTDAKTVITCVCGATIKQGSLSDHLISLKHFKAIGEMPEIPEKKQQRRDKLGEYHAAWTRARVVCECGKELSKGYLTHHLNTNAHRIAMETAEPMPAPPVEPRHECTTCGAMITERGRSRHETSKRHIAAVTG